MTAMMAIPRDVGDFWSALISAKVLVLAADQCYPCKSVVRFCFVD
jgi:hypothetical protein